MMQAIFPALRRCLGGLSLSAGVLAFAALASFNIGCQGQKDGENKVSGSVTLNGKPVDGIVTFVYADGKEFMAPTNPDGSYTVINTPPGQAKVAIKAKPGAASSGPLIPTKDTPTKDAPQTMTTSGVAPPQKYQNVATSNLTYEVTKGKQQKDFPLQ